MRCVFHFLIAAVLLRLGRLKGILILSKRKDWLMLFILHYIDRFNCVPVAQIVGWDHTQRGWWPIAWAVVSAGVQRFVSCSWVQRPFRSFGWELCFDWVHSCLTPALVRLGACQEWRLGWSVKQLHSWLVECCLSWGWGAAAYPGPVVFPDG